MFANNGKRLVQVCVLLALIWCFLHCKANLEGFPNCTGYAGSIGDGYCHYIYNNEACGWDGGDCCECTCVFNPERDSSCEPNSFSCMNPGSGCVNSSLLEYVNCNGDAASIGNGLCDFYNNNNEACGWDGGDCCKCTCAPDCEDENEYDLFCLDPNSECADPTLLKYTNCTGYVFNIGNGECNSNNNNEACGWDGGDCCECTCLDGEYYHYCGYSSYFCKDPDSGCTDPLVVEYSNCSGELSTYGDAWCDSENNNQACGWDGGDCCECTCERGVCIFNLIADNFECLDPEAADKSPMYGCLDRPPASIPCPSQKKEHWKVETTSQATDLANALNCSGGVFEVTWNGSVIVDQPIVIVDGTILNITGVGSSTAIDGRGALRLFTAWNASLYVSNMVVMNGNSTSGGAIAALGSEVSLSRTMFDGNVATSEGGAVFVGGGSTLTCGDETGFYNNFAVRGGAISVRDRSSATWTGGVTFASNSAGFGGAVDISFHSSVSWSAGGGSTFVGNNAFLFGGGLNIFSDSSARWEGGSTFEANTASDGGGMFISDSKATWEGESIFEGNTAEYSGGGMYISNSSVTWTGKISSFSRNHVSSSGGAVYGSYHSSISWAGEALFSSNVAEYVHGGAVYITHVTTISWSAVTTFISNTASDYGGGVCLEDGSTASWMGNTTFSKNNVEFGDGGALYVSSSSSMLIGGNATFAGNTAIAGDGGALFLEGQASLEGNTTFADNIAGNLGGAICMMEGGSSISFNRDAFFIKNNAYSGGALVAASELTISDEANATFLQNFAEVYGGAVYISSMEVGPLFHGAHFAYNHAQVGGAVYAVASGTTVTRYASEDKNPSTFENCSFTNNEAYATGGAVSCVAGQDMFVNSIFVGNVAGSGGALQLAGAASVFNCVFERNIADSGGGPAVSNIGYLPYVNKSVLSGNVVQCEEGRFLNFTEGLEEELWAIVCDGCDKTLCADCDFGGTVLVPQCILMSDAGIEHASSRGGLTTLENLDIDEGYWRATANSTYVLECYNRNACKGGVTGTLGFCREGYQGAYCSVCSKNYTASLNFECTPCTARKWGIVIVSIVSGVSVVVGIAIILYLLSGETAGSGRGVIDRVTRLVPLQSLKIVIVAWQIVTQFASVVNVTFPDVYQRFLDAVDLINLEFSWVLSTGCVFSFDFHDKLLIVTIGPIVGLFLLGITYFTAARKHHHSEAAVRNIRHKHVSMVLLVTFLVYSSVSSTVFQMFACEVLDDGSDYLRADYRINCDSSKHKELQIYAGFMILLYPVGIPLLYAVLLFKDRTVLRKEAERNVSSKVKSTSDLWKPYKPSRFYYEIIECARRICLTGAVVFIYPNTVAQIAVTIVAAFTFAMLSEALAPYNIGWDCWISRTGHVVVYMSMYIALLLKTDVSRERTSSQGLLASVLVAAHICMVLAVLIEAVVMAFSVTILERDEPRRNVAYRMPFIRPRACVKRKNIHGVLHFDDIEKSVGDAKVEANSPEPI